MNTDLRNKAGKVSKKKLEAFCRSVGTPTMPSYEAYGRLVCAYVSVPAGMTRREFESLCEAHGLRTSPKWNRDSDLETEIENISYFKAFGWDK